MKLAHPRCKLLRVLLLASCYGLLAVIGALFSISLSCDPETFVLQGVRRQQLVPAHELVLRTFTYPTGGVVAPDHTHCVDGVCVAMTVYGGDLSIVHHSGKPIGQARIKFVVIGKKRLLALKFYELLLHKVGSTWQWPRVFSLRLYYRCGRMKLPYR